MIPFGEGIVEFSLPEVKDPVGLFVFNGISPFYGFFDERFLAAQQVQLPRDVKLRPGGFRLSDHLFREEFVSGTKHEIGRCDRRLIENKRHRKVAVQPEAV